MHGFNDSPEQTHWFNNQNVLACTSNYLKKRFQKIKKNNNLLIFNNFDEVCINLRNVT